jgi:hypothetical protein
MGRSTATPFSGPLSPTPFPGGSRGKRPCLSAGSVGGRIGWHSVGLSRIRWPLRMLRALYLCSGGRPSRQQWGNGLGVAAHYR